MITLATSGESTVDASPLAATPAATPAAAPSASPAPTPTFFLELPGMNSPEFRGHGDLMETAVMLHRTAEKEKAKLRHLFLFESVSGPSPNQQWHLATLFWWPSMMEISWVYLGLLPCR